MNKRTALTPLLATLAPPHTANAQGPDILLITADDLDRLPSCDRVTNVRKRE